MLMTKAHGGDKAIGPPKQPLNAQRDSAKSGHPLAERAMESPGQTSGKRNRGLSPRSAPDPSLQNGPRVAFLGPAELIEDWTPIAPVSSFAFERFAADVADDGRRLVPDAIRHFEGEATVVLDPASFDPATLAALKGTTLGVLPRRPVERDEPACAALDRLVSFNPALTGAPVGGREIWRAIPPPVSDAFFSEPRPLHRAPRAITLGRSTPHREETLIHAKHYHDLLQIIHGVHGQHIAEILRDYDVGVYVDENGGEFGWQVGAHLAAGNLLFSEPLRPAHGLEMNIDYVKFESPEDLLLSLNRLASFPEMYWRTRVRGHLKAEHFRASRVFGRIVHDLLADVAAFGTSETESQTAKVRLRPWRRRSPSASRKSSG